ncbi:MAG: T9SS type A sorting domain-containing protein [Bacteroidota bacterium]|nr:T9SS type A sorting domain-containing protein [Bacteroidota bacterium]
MKWQLLVNEKLLAGSYKVEFNGSHIPSGIYFYKIESEALELRTMNSF